MRLARFALILWIMMLAACATGPRISTDTDPQADFSRYRSFAFHAPLAVEKEGYATPASNLMRAAARREMEARGYVYDEAAPDLWVNINAYLDRRTEVVAVPELRYGWYYNYRANAYAAVPYWSERRDVYNYTEGTLNIDLVDARARSLVWEGVAVGRVARLKPEDRQARIEQTISEIFAQYPHRAN